MSEVWGVVLAGGVGSRFWPMSVPSRPKQLLPLVEERPMLAATVDRLTPLVPRERVLVLTSDALAGPSLDVLRDFPSSNIITEPRAAGTAAALAWAAMEVQRRGGPDAVMVCVHADWFIGEPDAFREALQQAVDVASSGGLVTVGVVPTRPDIGFGYIQPGEPMESHPSARRVARFIEKPDRKRAEEMCSAGFLWNSGIFAWRAAAFLDEVRRHTPEVAGALDLQSRDEFFASVTPVSVDVGVLERSDNVAVLPGDFGWDDVGTWGALQRVLPRDARNNVVMGTAYLVSSERNVVYSRGTTVVLYGVSDLVVVCDAGLTMVTTTDRASDLKSLLQQLPTEVAER